MGLRRGGKVREGKEKEREREQGNGIIGFNFL